MKKIILPLLIIVLLLQLYLPGMAANNIKSYLLEHLDDAENLRVETRSFPAWEILFKKRVDHLIVKADLFQVEKLKLSNVRAEYEDASYSDDQIKGENTDLNLEITESALNQYLEERYPELEGVVISLDPDRVNLSGYLSVFDNRIAVHISGGLKIDKVNQVIFQPEEIRVEEVSLPGAFVQSFLSEMGFVIDLNRLEIPINAENIRVSRDRIYITGGMSAGKA